MQITAGSLPEAGGAPAHSQEVHAVQALEVVQVIFHNAILIVDA